MELKENLRKELPEANYCVVNMEKYIDKKKEILSLGCKFFWGANRN